MNAMSVGSAAPWFNAPALSANPNYAFDTAGGRAILLLFAGSAGWPKVEAALAQVLANRRLFDDANACFFGVSIDPADVSENRIAQQLPGIRWFIDHDRQISIRYGVAVDRGDGSCSYRPRLLLLDHRLRVAGSFAIEDAALAIEATARLAASGCETPTAPVLVVPRVFEPELCRRLIDTYEANGGGVSGFMRERDGRTVPVVDASFKRRNDHILQDPALLQAIKLRLERHLLPELERAYNFTVTRIERWLIACYDGAEGGFFSPHRDNTTKGTAHRRFACTINLNAEEFTGGELRFPEYGAARYRAPTGGAVIFGCGLLHEATPVTSGKRYAFLPFFHDEAAEELRQRNLVYLAA